MKEIEIELIDIDPRDFFGNNNENIDKIKLYFPKLKIVARGNKIKAFGQKEVLKEFKEGLNKLLKYFTKHNSINEYFIENLFNGNNENLTSKISNNNRLTYKLEHELSIIPSEIEKLEIIILQMNNILSDADLYTKNIDKFLESSKILQMSKKKLDELETRWLELDLKKNKL